MGFEGGVWAAASAAAAAVAAVAVGTGPPRAARCEAHAGADLNTSAGAGARPAGEGQNEASEAAGGAGGRPAPGPTLLTLEQRKRIFFLYEQKIRMLSSLEKVFEYFASEEGEGEEETLMTPLDLVHACVPVHQPTESFETRTGFLQGEPNAGSGGRGGGVGSGRHDDDEYAGDDVSSFFARFADGGSGLIDYPGYLFFLTILSVPPSHVRTLFRLFDLDGNGVVTRDEFAAVLKVPTHINTHTPARAHTRRASSRVHDVADTAPCADPPRRREAQLDSARGPAAAFWTRLQAGERGRPGVHVLRGGRQGPAHARALRDLH